ncbi:hypothetical protein [Pontibacillus yanchengensis]|nr:hypothetical protein [Pontibacillus yanchengensis]
MKKIMDFQHFRSLEDLNQYSLTLHDVPIGKTKILAEKVENV